MILSPSWGLRLEAPTFGHAILGSRFALPPFSFEPTVRPSDLGPKCSAQDFGSAFRAQILAPDVGDGSGSRFWPYI